MGQRMDQLQFLGMVHDEVPFRSVYKYAIRAPQRDNLGITGTVSQFQLLGRPFEAHMAKDECARSGFQDEILGEQFVSCVHSAGEIALPGGSATMVDLLNNLPAITVLPGVTI